MFLINVDYPSDSEEMLIMKMGTGMKRQVPQAVLSAEHILYIQETVKLIPVPDHVYEYAKRIVRCSRPNTPEALEPCKKWLRFGAGPRASLGLIMAAKAHALMHGQVYVSCEDVAAVAFSVLRHRLAINFTALSEGITPDDVVRKILEQIPTSESLS
jgi:MoxR-like ATPase